MYKIGDFKFSASCSTEDTPYWLYCDGRSLLRTSYLELFEQIGTTYGNISANTFNLPDCRGRTLAMQNSIPSANINVHNIGDSIGEENHILTTDEIPSHNHTGTTDPAGIHNHGTTVGAYGLHGHGNLTNNDTDSNQIYGQNSNVYLNIHQHAFPISSNLLNSSYQGKIDSDDIPSVSVINYSPVSTISGLSLDNTNSVHIHPIYSDGIHNHGLNTDGGHTHTFNTNPFNNTTEGHNNIQPTLFIGHTFIMYRNIVPI